MNNNNNKKTSSVGAYDIPESELRMELATFGDGSRIIPRIAVQTGKKYVVWKDNANSSYVDYPTKLLELYNNSSLHHAIIDMKAEQIAGGGLKVKDEESPKAKQTQEFIDKINGQDINLSEVNNRLALDLTIFNGFNTQTVWRKDWKAIDDVIHLEYNKVRAQTPDNEGNQYGYFYAFDWGMYRPTKVQYVEKFNTDSANLKAKEYKEITERIMEENKDEDVNALKDFIASGNTQLFYYKKYQPNTFYYPLPDYVGVIPSVETDILSDIYASSSLANGMDNGIMITMLGDSSDPESQKTAKRILKSYSGARKAGKPVIVFAETFEDAPKIDDIGNSNSLAAKYRIVNESVQQKILSGHRIPSSSLVGIQVAGKLGNTDNDKSQELFFNSYIRPRQVILEKYWNTIMKVNGLEEVEIINTNVFNEAAIETEEAGVEADSAASEVDTPKNAE